MKDRIVLNYNCTYSVQTKKKFLGITYWKTIKVCNNLGFAEGIFKALKDGSLCEDGVIVAQR